MKKRDSLSILAYVMILVGLIFMGSCSTDDSAQQEEPVLFQYAADSLEVRLGTSGSIPKPQMGWPGQKGTFSLQEPVEGIELDQETGEIQWTSSLPIGANTIRVNAESPEGKWETQFVLSRIIKNTFWVVTFSDNEDPEDQTPTHYIELDTDYKLEIYEIGNGENSHGTGTWEQHGATAQLRFCTYCPDADPNTVSDMEETLLIEADIFSSPSKTYMSGQLFNYHKSTQQKEFDQYCYLERD